MSFYGIDFGTTTSAAVELASGTMHKYGEFGFPLRSIVRIDRLSGKAECGYEVWKGCTSSEASGRFHVIRSIKPLLTREQPWTTEKGNWNAEEIAALILSAVSRQVQTAQGGGQGIRAATIAVPATITADGLKVLRRAADAAGIEVTGFVKEPTAALIAHLREMANRHYVAIFDWGGGTLDVSILELRGRKVFELWTDGTHFAGNRIDEELARFIHSQVGPAGVLFEEVDPAERDELVFACERAKISLEKRAEAPVSIVRYAGRPVNFILKREDAAAVLRVQVRKALDLLEASIRRAGLGPDQIDEVLLVGGSSRLWLLTEEIDNDERFSARYRKAKDAEWDVAHGAAIIQQSPGCYRLAETIALRLSDNGAFDLVRPGTTFPSDQRHVDLALVEDAPAATIILDRWQSDEKLSREQAVQFSVPAMGFHLEAIRLAWRLTENLTMEVRGECKARGPSSRVDEEIPNLRFEYELSHEQSAERTTAA